MPIIDVGQGTETFPWCKYGLGAQYDGEVAKPDKDSPCYLDYAHVDLPNGTGVLTLAEGIRIEGAFVDGRANGEALWSDSRSGWSYLGEFRDGEKHGQVVIACTITIMRIYTKSSKSIEK